MRNQSRHTLRATYNRLRRPLPPPRRRPDDTVVPFAEYAATRDPQSLLRALAIEPADRAVGALERLRNDPIGFESELARRIGLGDSGALEGGTGPGVMGADHNPRAHTEPVVRLPRSAR